MLRMINELAIAANGSIDEIMFEVNEERCKNLLFELGTNKAMRKRKRVCAKTHLTNKNHKT